MKFYDAFGGIGGIRLGLERAGHECVGYCDNDKHAVACYNARFNEKHEATDIRKLKANELPDFDLLVGGFPCQSFSLAGKRKGIEETRGTLFAELVRIAREREPSHLLFENVKGLLSSGGGRDFAVILNAISELGYCVEWQVLNSKHFGVPQNRERIFIHGFRGESGREILPLRASRELVINSNEKEHRSGERISSYLHGGYANLQGQGETYIVKPCSIHLSNPGMQGRRIKEPDEESFTLRKDGKNDCATTLRTNYSNGNAQIIQLNNPKHAGDRVYSPNGLSPALRARARQDQYASPKIVIDASLGAPIDFKKVDWSKAIVKTDEFGRVYFEIKGRRFTIKQLLPIECERLQGFPDFWTLTAIKDGKEYQQSDSQRYKQLGNAVTVSVIQALGEALEEVESL